MKTPLMLGYTNRPTSTFLAQIQNRIRSPGVRNRDNSGLMDGGAYISEARSWSDTPVCMAAGRQDKVAVFFGGRGREF